MKIRASLHKPPRKFWHSRPFGKIQEGEDMRYTIIGYKSTTTIEHYVEYDKFRGPEAKRRKKPVILMVSIFIPPFLIKIYNDKTF